MQLYYLVARWAPSKRNRNGLLEDHVRNDLIMAAEKSCEFLYGAVALRAFHGLRDDLLEEHVRNDLIMAAEKS